MNLSIFDWIYPPRCIFCHNIIPINKYAQLDICEHCIKTLPFIKEPTCNKCGKSLNNDKEFCNDCYSKEHLYKKGFITLEYIGMTIEAIYRFKYMNCPHYSKTFAYIMYEDMKNKNMLNYNFDLIIPIPLHINKLKKRGYNQAELLAKELSYKLKIPYEPIIKRIKDTKPQNSLSPKERYNNLKSAFEIIDIDKIKDKKVLLIDDIYTTGATMDACVQVLIDNNINADMYYYTLSGTIGAINIT